MNSALLVDNPAFQQKYFITAVKLDAFMVIIWACFGIKALELAVTMSAMKSSKLDLPVQQPKPCHDWVIILQTLLLSKVWVTLCVS